jgi:hypothetical protein
MGGTFGMYGEREEVHIGIWRGDPMEGEQVEDLAIDGRSYSAVNFVLILVFQSIDILPCVQMIY